MHPHTQSVRQSDWPNSKRAKQAGRQTGAAVGGLAGEQLPAYLIINLDLSKSDLTQVPPSNTNKRCRRCRRRRRRAVAGQRPFSCRGAKQRGTGLIDRSTFATVGYRGTFGIFHAGPEYVFNSTSLEEGLLAGEHRADATQRDATFRNVRNTSRNHGCTLPSLSWLLIRIIKLIK